jgi:hypothetical protein
MRIIELVIIFIIFVGVVWLLTMGFTIIRAAWQRHRTSSSEWKTWVTGEGGKCYVVLSRADQIFQVAVLDPNDPDFDIKLYEAEAKADEMAATFNAGDVKTLPRSFTNGRGKS